MEPLFLAGHPALDFLNTSMAPLGTPIEFIGDGPSFVDWLVRAGLLDPAAAARARRRFKVETLDATAAQARKLREWAAVWIGRWRDAPNGDHSAELRRLNALLGRARWQRQLAPAEGGLRLVEHCCIGAADELVALVAAQLALLVATEPSALIKRCAGAACTNWFLDRTKARRRLFCSASVCGNRAKVAAFRKRQRAG